MVSESLRERIEDHPFFLTERQIPKHVSNTIDSTAINTNGETGAIIARVEIATMVNFVFIRTPLFDCYNRCHCNHVHKYRHKVQRSYTRLFEGVNLYRGFRVI